ncbi:MAG: AI-2E family transporter [Planctomycetota bacterium]|nr:MAG: AI-2E family transporter [Planctomycetota bacterium]
MAKPGRQNTYLLAVVATVLVGWVLHVGASILQPLVIAMFLATMLQPLVVLLKRWYIPPALTVVGLVTLFFLGVARLGILVQENVASFFGEQMPAVEGSLEPGAPAVENAENGEGSRVEEGVEDSSEALQDPEPGREGLNPIQGEAELDPKQDPMEESSTPESSDSEAAKEEEGPTGWDKVRQDILTRLGQTRVPKPALDMARNFLEELDPQSIAPGILGGGIGFLRGLTLVVIYMLFIFAEQAVFRRKILAAAGDRREEASEVLHTIGKGIQKYLGVKTVVSLATGALCYTALQQLEVPYAELFGFLTFMMNFIPTFGSIIASIFPTVVAMTTHGGGTALLVLVIYLTVNLTLGSFLEPKILGRELNLSPLVIIVSVVVWAGLWGVVGTFLAVPITSTLQIILANLEQTKPIAMMLSIGPPKEEKERRRWRRVESDSMGGE